MGFSSKSAKAVARESQQMPQTFSNIRAFPGYICCRSHLVTKGSAQLSAGGKNDWNCEVMVQQHFSARLISVEVCHYYWLYEIY